jgi:hypothetical protein
MEAPAVSAGRIAAGRICTVRLWITGWSTVAVLECGRRDRTGRLRRELRRITERAAPLLGRRPFVLPGQAARGRGGNRTRVTRFAGLSGLVRA